LDENKFDLKGVSHKVVIGLNCLKIEDVALLDLEVLASFSLGRRCKKVLLHLGWAK
jgi:hypothetical protein